MPKNAGIRGSIATQLQTVDNSSQANGPLGNGTNSLLSLEDDIAKKTMIFNYMPWSRKSGQKRSITQSRYGNRPITAILNSVNASASRLQQSANKQDEDSV